jgi:hypothetical protein
MMRVHRIIAVGFVFLLATGGWLTLGTVTRLRSNDMDALLGRAVQGLWGEPIVQDAPSLTVQVPGAETVRRIPPTSNTIDVSLGLEYRKKGLIWYSTYNCDFKGTYAVTNAEEVAQSVHVHFPFPSPKGTYDNFSILLDDVKQDTAINPAEGIREILELAPGQTRTFTVTYRTRGLDAWRYRPGRDTGRVKGLALTVKTNFREVDFPDGTLSPTRKTEEGDAMALAWTAKDLLTTQDIGVLMPERLNPGPLSSRITYFAPVCLVFFFVLVATVNIIYRVDIHPMHYLFVAAGFVAFHLLFAYLVDHLAVHASFWIAAIASVALVTVYLRGALGASFPWKTAGAGQVFYLVLFSYSFFLKGMTGLTVTIGSVITLAVLMAVTARTDWNRVFAARPRTRPAPATPPAAGGEASGQA